MKLKRKLLALVLGLALVMGALAGCSSDSKDEKETTKASAEPVTLNVFIAASLKNAMADIQKEYAKEHSNVTLVFNPDSSGTLQTQIEEGAECDIFFSAATKQMNALKDKNLVKADSIVNLLQNDLVLIKAKGSKTEVTGFDNVTKAANIALGADGVPAGDYAKKVFTKLGILDAVTAMEVNRGANVTAVLTAVSEGSNEIGVVYKTDALSMKDSVEIITSAPEGSLDEPVIYPVGLVENSAADDNQKKAAEEFLKYLQKDAAIKIFEEYGFSSAK